MKPLILARPVNSSNCPKRVGGQTVSAQKIVGLGAWKWGDR